MMGYIPGSAAALWQDEAGVISVAFEPVNRRQAYIMVMCALSQ
jgi:hypothetical protein